MRPLLMFALSAILLSAQGGGLTLRVDVPLVSLDVSVTDSSENPMTTLAADDFLIYEDGSLQQIQNFSSVIIPFNALLLFDCSGSTKPQEKLMTALMTGFTGGLRAQDMIAIAQFGAGIDLRQDWRPVEGGPIEAQLGVFAGCDTTDFYGAVDWAARKLNGVRGRKGVLIYTDGLGPMPMRSMVVGGKSVFRPVDSNDDPGFQKVLQAVRSSGSSFYFVAISTDLNPTGAPPPSMIYTLQQARARMEQLAEASGGRVAFPKNKEDAIPMYEQIGRELGISYSLGYVSSNAAESGRFRTIVVRLRDGTARVRQSREGYVVP